MTHDARAYIEDIKCPNYDENVLLSAVGHAPIEPVELQHNLGEFNPDLEPYEESKENNDFFGPQRELSMKMEEFLRTVEWQSYDFVVEDDCKELLGELMLY